jgi:hypothetical protein
VKWHTVTCCTVLFSVAVTVRLSAQKIDSTLRSFRTPTSPTLVLLGAAPTSVERPSTPQSLVLSLVSTLGDETFPPQHYALEVAPYWLTRHRTLTFDEYAAPGFWQSLKQTLSISVATASLTAADTGTTVGFGVRTGYVSSRDLRSIRPLRDSLRQIQMSMLRTDNAAETARLESRAQAIALRLQRALKTERLGWTVEAAAAGLMDFSGNLANNGKVARAGIWITSGYRLSKPRADLLTVVRLTRDERFTSRQDYLDLGGRIVLDKEDLSISGEYVWRSINASGSSRQSYQLAAVAEYRLANEVYLTGSLGRGVEDNGPGSSKLIAQLGIDFGLGPVPIIGTQ